MPALCRRGARAGPGSGPGRLLVLSRWWGARAGLGAGLGPGFGAGLGARRRAGWRAGRRLAPPGGLALRGAAGGPGGARAAAARRAAPGAGVAARARAGAALALAVETGRSVLWFTLMKHMTKHCKGLYIFIHLNVIMGYIYTILKTIHY